MLNFRNVYEAIPRLSKGAPVFFAGIALKSSGLIEDRRDADKTPVPAILKKSLRVASFNLFSSIFYE
jgi:hypothetical protein